MCKEHHHCSHHQAQECGHCHHEHGNARLPLRIGAAVLLFAAAVSGLLPPAAGTALFVAAWFVAGADIVYAAGRNILRGKWLDENALMTIATLGAVFLGEYPEAAMVMILFQSGEYLQHKAVESSKRSIAELMDIRPDYACREENGTAVRRRPEEIAVGDVIIVKSGEKIPLDGLVTDGEATVDTSALTGESLPRRLVPGSEALGVEIGKVFSQGCDTALLENHGVCIGAPDMFTAFQRFETLNYTATLEVLASKLGKIHSLPENAYHMSETNAHTKLDDFIPRSHTSEELAARRDMITLIHRSYKMGLFTATHGTYSVRLSDGSFLITPFGFDRAYLEEDDLVRVKGGMKELGKTPSRAVLLHQKIYEQHPDVGAILLAHPVHAMAFAVTDAAFDARTIPESYILLRDVKTLPYEEIYREPDKMAAEFDVSHPVAIVENDCVIVTGNSLLQAFDRLEVMELTANSILDSQSLGSIVHISDSEIADLKTAFHLED